MRNFSFLGLLFSTAALSQVAVPQVLLPKFQDVAQQVGLTVSHISSL
jgi:hypothetical protein